MLLVFISVYLLYRTKVRRVTLARLYLDHLDYLEHKDLTDDRYVLLVTMET